MAKNVKLIEAQARIAELEKQVEDMIQKSSDVLEDSRKEALENGKMMVGLMLYVRDAYVKTLTPQIIEESPFGKVVVDVLKRLEEKSPSVTCSKCSGTGCVDIRGSWMICYACVCGRILGKPGMMTVVDRKVQQVHEEQSRKNRENRFTRYGPSKEEIDRAEQLRAEKAKSNADADVAF